MSNEPIEPQDYIHGVNVVHIGDLRVARGLTRRPRSSCKHKQLNYDTHERRIWCQDCESDVDAFDAFAGLASYFDVAQKKLDARKEALDEVATFKIRSRAAKRMDEYWRSTKTVPCCPHCRVAILPEDIVNNHLHRGNKKQELERRRFLEKAKKQ